MSYSAQDLIKGALRSIGVIASGETPSADELADGLEALYQMIQAWSAQRLMVFSIINENFSLTGGTSSYSIGSGGDFDTTRPVRIEGGWIRDSASLDYPLAIRGESYYRDLASKSTTGTPRDLYYNPIFPLGLVYLYPTPSSSLTIYLDNWRPLAEPTGLTNNVVFAPEYNEAVKFNLAMRLASEYGKTTSDELRSLAVAGIKSIKSINAALQNQEIKLEMLKMTRGWSINEG